MFHSLAGIVGGLGLFFAGVWFLTENLKSLSGRRIRRVIINWTRNRWMAFGWGILAAGITQSMSVLVFLLVGMATAGFIPVAAALPIIAGGNVGGCLLILLAVMDIEVVMLFVIGITGTVLSRGSKTIPLPLIAALFGLSMLFLGLTMLQQSAVPLVQQPWAQALLADTRDSYLIGFIVGAVLTIIAQSGIAIGILVVTLAGAGVFGFEQTIMIIYGSNFGSSLNTLILSWQLRGRPMQIALFQISLNFIGSLILVPLFYLEIYTDIPLINALVMALPGGIEQKMAYVYLLFNLIAALTLMVFSSPILDLVARYFPPTRVEDDARPRYIVNQSLHDADTALDLVALEQARLLSYFSRYFDTLRQDSPEGSSPAALHDAFQRVTQEIEGFLEELGHLDQSHRVFNRLNRAITQQRLMITVEDTLYELATTIQSHPEGSVVEPFNQRVVEALDAVVLTLHGALVEGDQDDRDYLARVTGDRGDVMQRIRNAFLSEAQALDATAKISLLKTTNLCERLLWLLHGFTAIAQPSPAVRYSRGPAKLGSSARNW